MAKIKRAFINRGGEKDAVYFCGDMWMAENGGTVKAQWADDRDKIRRYFQEVASVNSSEDFLKSIEEEAAEIKLEDIAGSAVYETLESYFIDGQKTKLPETIKRAVVKAGDETDAVYFNGDMWMVENGGSVKVKWADDEDKLEEFFKSYSMANSSDAFLQSIKEDATEVRIEDMAGSEIYDILAGWEKAE